MTEVMRNRVNEILDSEEFENEFYDNGNALREKYLDVEANTDFESVCWGYAVCHESYKEGGDDAALEKALYEAWRAYEKN